ncbi:hypothetical protein P3T18_003108 [Paraburkholderia sp. GAS199]
MPLYQASPAGTGEKIFLERWCIRESNKGKRHFLGFSASDCYGRVSTPIVSFDPRTRTGVTSTGRKYYLLGRAGLDKDADYVWHRAARVWDITSWRDVTQQLCPDWRNPFPEAEADFDRPKPDQPNDSADR